MHKHRAASHPHGGQYSRVPAVPPRGPARHIYGPGPATQMLHVSPGESPSQAVRVPRHAPESRLQRVGCSGSPPGRPLTRRLPLSPQPLRDPRRQRVQLPADAAAVVRVRPDRGGGPPEGAAQLRRRQREDRKSVV